MEQKELVTERVIKDIKTMIQTNELKPGQRFPSERTLSQRFGVSRNSVREALHYFEVIGLASARVGSGTYLVDDEEALQKVLDARQVIGQYNWMEMVQARRVVEIGIVKLAAINANREDKIAIRNALNRVNETSKNAKTERGLTEHIMADYNFHRMIARSTHNAILMELQATMKGVILSGVEVWRNLSDTMDVANPAHIRIAEAIEKNDPEAAVRSMEEHLHHMETLIELSMKVKQK